MLNQFSLNAMAKSCDLRKQVVVDTEVDFICISKLMLMRRPEHVLTEY